MEKHIKLVVLLAGLSGILIVTASAFAYGQSSSQRSGQTSCGSMMGNTGTGMMGMGQHGSMNQDQCRTRMENGMVGCWMMTTQASETRDQQLAGMPCR